MRLCTGSLVTPGWDTGSLTLREGVLETEGWEVSVPVTLAKGRRVAEHRRRLLPVTRNRPLS